MQIRTNQSQRHNPNPRFKKILSLTLVFALSISIVNLAIFIPSIGAQTIYFTDLKGHWAEATIYALVKEGVVEGFPDGTFRPNDPVQVDQFIKMILMALSEEKENGERYWRDDFLEKISSFMKHILRNQSQGFTFENSKSGYWAQSYLDQARNMTILVRNDRWNGKFSEKLTREDVAHLALRTTRLFEEEEEFNYMFLGKGQIKDISLVKHDEIDVLQAYMKGIMSGYSDGTFGVNQLVTRAEAAAILRRILDDSKRNPYKPDLSGLPYAVVPTEFGKDKTIVFPNWEMKKAYDSLKNNLKESTGVTTYIGSSFVYYKDQTSYEKDMDRFQTLEGSFSPPFHDIVIQTNTDSNDYSFYINKSEGILDRHKSSILPYLEFMFEQESSNFLAQVSDKLEDINKGTFNAEIVLINNRRVNFIKSSSNEFLYIFISQKEI